MLAVVVLLSSCMVAVVVGGGYFVCGCVWAQVILVGRSNEAGLLGLVVLCNVGDCISIIKSFQSIR